MAYRTGCPTDRTIEPGRILRPGDVYSDHQARGCCETIRAALDWPACSPRSEAGQHEKTGWLTCFDAAFAVTSRFFGKTVIEAEPARPEGRDLKQATCHHHILEEVDHLIFVGEVAVERNRSRKAEQC